MSIPILQGEKQLKRNEGIYTMTPSRSESKTAVGTQVSYTPLQFLSTDCSAAQPTCGLTDPKFGNQTSKQLQGNNSDKEGSKDL